MKKFFAALMLLVMGWGTLQSASASAASFAQLEVRTIAPAASVAATQAQRSTVSDHIDYRADLPAGAALTSRDGQLSSTAYDARGPPVQLADLFPSGMRRLSQSLRASAPLVAAPKLAAAIARVKAGVGPAILANYGDSTVAGWGSGAATGTGADATADPIKSKAWPQRMAAMLQSATGVPTRSDAVFGTGLLTNSWTFARWAATNANISGSGSGWTAYSALAPGNVVAANTTASGTASDPVTFTPDVAANCFDIFFTLGVFTISDSNGVMTGGNVNVTAGGQNKVTVCHAGNTPSTGAISIQKVTASSTAMYLLGIRPYDTTSPRFEIWNMGWPGSTEANWLTSTQAWQAFNAIGYYPVDAATIELGANDIAANVTAASYQSNLQTMVAKVRSSPNSPDVLLVKCHPAVNGDNRNITSDYLYAIDAVTAANGLPAPINFNAGVVDKTAGDYNDAIHLSAQGYAKEAVVAETAIRAAAQLGGGPISYGYDLPRVANDNAGDLPRVAA